MKKISKVFLLLLIISTVFIFLSSKNVNASGEGIKIEFRLNGETEFDHSHIENNKENLAGFDYVSFEMYIYSDLPTTVSAMVFEMEENSIFSTILSTTSVKGRDPDNPFDTNQYDEWTFIGSSFSNPGLRFELSYGFSGAASINSTPRKIATFLIALQEDYLNDEIINFVFDDFAYIGSDRISESDVTFISIQVGDPNATPNAKLSGAIVEGSDETYNVTFDESDHASITLTYQDSLSALIVTPLFEKAGATEEIKVYDNNDVGKSLSGPFENGDYILITTQDDTETEEYRINITVTPVSTDNNIELK